MQPILLPSIVAAIVLVPTAAFAQLDVSVVRLSPDGQGRRAAIETSVSLVPEDTNGSADVYLHDFDAGTSTLLSVSTQGGAGNGRSQNPFLSADGRTVVFSSQATDLVAGAPSYGTYLYEVETGQTTLLLAQHAAEAMTPDARFVAATYLEDLGGTLFAERLWLLDRTNGALEPISINDQGTFTASASGWENIRTAAISADGRFVAFVSYATNVDPSDVDVLSSLYVRDRAAAHTFLQGGFSSEHMALARDGSLAAWSAFLGGLGPIDVQQFSIGQPSGQCSTIVADGLADNGTRLLVTENYYQFVIPGQGCANQLRRPWVIDIVTGTPTAGPSTAGTQSVVAYELSADGQVVVGFCFNQPCRWTLPAVYPSPWFTCHGKTSSIGCVPHESFSGLPSLSGVSSVQLAGTELRNQTSAMVLWGLGPQSTPFGGGILCLAAPLHRTPLQNSGGTVGQVDCSGVIAFDFDAAYLAQQGLSVGMTVHTQVYGRDPGFAPPENVQLSSAVAFVVGP